MALQPFMEHIRQMLDEGNNYTDISLNLHQRGIIVDSTMANIRVFYRENGINPRARRTARRRCRRSNTTGESQ